MPTVRRREAPLRQPCSAGGLPRVGLAVCSPGAGHGGRRSGAETRGSPPWGSPPGFGEDEHTPLGEVFLGKGGGVLPSGSEPPSAISEPARLLPARLRRRPSRRREEPSGAEAGQRCRRFEAPLGAVHHGNRLKAAAVPGLRMAAAEPSPCVPLPPSSGTGAGSPGASHPSEPPVMAPAVCRGIWGGFSACWD